MPPTPHGEQPPLLWGLPPILPEGRMQALVLGSFPSVASLESKQYYAHPQNWFWRVLEHCGVIESASAPYEERVRRLRRIGLGVWDLYGQVRREGSGDDRIHDAVTNRIDLLHERERPLPHPPQRPPPARMESQVQRDRGKAHPAPINQPPPPPLEYARIPRRRPGGVVHRAPLDRLPRTEWLRCRVRTRTSPGETLLEDCVEALHLTIADAARHLRVEEEALAAICECRAPITADMAVRFEQAFGSTADHWLRMQAAHDLAQARKTACKIKRIERAVYLRSPRHRS